MKEIIVNILKIVATVIVIFIIYSFIAAPRDTTEFFDNLISSNRLPGSPGNIL